MTFPKLLDPRSHWQVYGAVLIGLAEGAAVHFGYHIPSWVEWGLAIAGIGTAHQAVASKTSIVIAAAIDLAKTILGMVAAPSQPDTNADTTGATVKTAPVEVHVLPPVPSAKVE